MRLIVCPLSQLDAGLAFGPSHVVSLLSPGAEDPASLGASPARRLALRFNDITQPAEGLIPPDRQSIEALIDFRRDWPRAAPLLVHCWAGISRSTAAAYILACEQAGVGEERHLAESLRRAAPQASPNTLMVAIADEILGRAGAMTAAVAEIGRGAEASEGQLFSLEFAPSK